VRQNMCSYGAWRVGWNGAERRRYSRLCTGFSAKEPKKAHESAMGIAEHMFVRGSRGAVTEPGYRPASV
jgi:hypothetical protein